ncbi:MAG TPA: dTDP-4-dehydrorhamnose 3,5-epimerase [Alphaproteobacteria bacterium]|jgi:dTDP-4-dehydrorhamnose 3,5-epimerase
MKKLSEPLPGVAVFEWPIHRDRRGCFLEIFRADKLAAHGIAADFVQDNISSSHRGVLRGLHFQNPHAQGKFVIPLSGRIYDVTVDVRRDSPHFGRWAAVELDGDEGTAIWIPPGFAHGFQVLSEQSTVLYKVTEFWAAGAEHTIRWDDPALGIAWPVADPVLSDKDALAPLLAELTCLPAL